MSSYRFIQLDVFTEEPFAGNPLAVFPEAEGRTDEQMLKIARAMNLSETVFVFKRDSNQQSANSKQQAESNSPSTDVSQQSAKAPGTEDRNLGEGGKEESQAECTAPTVAP